MNPVSFFILQLLLSVILGFADTEHLGSANRANTLGRGLAILHGNVLGILDFSLGTTLNAIGLH